MKFFVQLAHRFICRKLPFIEKKNVTATITLLIEAKLVFNEHFSAKYCKQSILHKSMPVQYYLNKLVCDRRPHHIYYDIAKQYRILKRKYLNAFIKYRLTII